MLTKQIQNATRKGETRIKTGRLEWKETTGEMFNLKLLYKRGWVRKQILNLKLDKSKMLCKRLFV